MSATYNYEKKQLHQIKNKATYQDAFLDKEDTPIELLVFV